MRLTSSLAYTRPTPVPKMPPGLVEMMQGMTKDVLKNNPSNVYEFCVNHFEKLLEMRDGPSPGKSLTLEEKIVKAQEKVRQRAQERQRHYDNEVERNVKHDVPENVDSVERQNAAEQELMTNLRVPVHHDQELSFSSEVEISHEPTDNNSLTSKDSNFDESEEIPISKSSTFSSVSKSTVIDLIAGGDHESNNKEDIVDGIENIDIPIIEINKDEGLEESEVANAQNNKKIGGENIEIPLVEINKVEGVDESEVANAQNNKITEGENIEIPLVEINKDEGVDASEVANAQNNKITEGENIEIPLVEINKDEGMDESEVANAQNNGKTVNENIEKLKIEINKDEPVKESTIYEPSTDDNDILKEKNESLATQVDKEESDSAVFMPDNLAKELDNTVELQPSDFVKSDIESEQEINFKSLDEVNVMIEKDENIVNEFETNNDTTAEIETGISIQEVKNYVEVPTMNVADDNSKELVTIDNVSDENSDNNQVSDIAAESLNETTQPESVSDRENIVTDDYTNVSDPNESYKQIEKPNESVQKSDVEDNEENIQKSDSMESNNIENESESVNTDSDKNKEVFGNESKEDSTNTHDLKHNPDDDLQQKYSLMFPEDNENVSKEDNSNSSSASIQRSDSGDNIDDTSVIGSDLSKAEEDINKSNHGQNNINLETAAETIQKVFRSFLYKSRNSTFEDITNDEETSLEEDNDKNKEEYYATANLSKERRPLGITRMDTVLQTVNEEKSLSLSTDDSSTTLSSAATTIQAHVRGFLVRNRLNSYKTVSTNSLVNSNEMLDTDTEQQKNKTVLNIHIVPEEGNYLSRDESLITSMDLSLDESPPSSINLHPLSYDLVSERRKLLKREDAIQSVSPPTNNSGKLSEDSVKEVLHENDVSKTESNINEKEQLNSENDSPETLVTAVNVVSVPDTCNEPEDTVIATEKRKRSMSSDESDVVTPFVASPRSLEGEFENTSKLIHSGEFHDVVLPTKVSRSDTTVVREFKNVLAYILLWNNS